MLTPSNQYLQAVEEINDYVNQAKCRASVSVNSEIMKTNIFIGNVIIRNSEWGNKFVENLSKDMKMRFPSAKGYSVRNLKYMKKFAQTFTEDDVDEYGLGRITYEITEEQDCTFVLWIGSRRMIKRKAFEEYIEKQYSI